MPSNAYISIITQGFGTVTLEFSESLLSPDNVVAVWQPDFKSILVSWTDTNDQETDYGIFRSEDGKEFYFLTTVPKDTVAFLDTRDLKNGVRYQYKIYAISSTSFGPGSYSNILEARNIPSDVSFGDIFDYLKFNVFPIEQIIPRKNGFVWLLTGNMTSSDLTSNGFSYILDGKFPIRLKNHGFKFTVSEAVTHGG